MSQREEKENLTAGNSVMPSDSGGVWSVMLLPIIPENLLDVFWLEFWFAVFSLQHFLAGVGNLCTVRLRSA